MKNLVKRLKDKTAVIGVIGLGYVGLPLCLRFINKKFKVIGIENNLQKIDQLKKFTSSVPTIKKNEIKKALNKNFIVTNKYNFISKCDIIIICVPTPIKNNKNPDMSYIKFCASKIKKYLRSSQLIALESTVYPGATEEYFLPIIKNRKFQIGKNYFLGFSPEREDPGNKDFSIKKGNIPKVISGHSKKCLKVMRNLYKNISSTVPVTSIKTAEFTKLLENVYRSVNIGFVNEMKVIANSMGIDINESIEAAKTKPFGYKAFYPGPGPGGHCIPVDPYILAWKAKKHNVQAKFIELSGNINKGMCAYIIHVLKMALKKYKKTLYGKKIFVLGLSYKKNTNDLRESPSFRLIKLLKKYKCRITCADPFLEKLDQKELIKNKQINNITEISKKNLKENDAVIIVTNHDKFSYSLIKKHAQIVIDTRNSFKYKNDKIYNA